MRGIMSVTRQLARAHHQGLLAFVGTLNYQDRHEPITVSLVEKQTDSMEWQRIEHVQGEIDVGQCKEAELCQTTRRLSQASRNQKDL